MNLRFALALALAVSVFSLDAAAQRGRVYGDIAASRCTSIRIFAATATFRNEVPDMREHALNDRISSLEVDGNQAWEVCRDANFGGGCRVFQGTIEDLRSEGWNDRISSMRAVNGLGGNNSRPWGWGNSQGNASRQSRLVLYVPCELPR